MGKSRRLLVSLWFFSLVLIVPAAAHSKRAFQYEDVVRKAEALAKKPFQQPSKLPGFLMKMDYDQWKDIRFKPKDALWLKNRLPFHVQFFFPGWVFNHLVKINVVRYGAVVPVKYSPDLFDYGMNKFNYNELKGLGFAGFRLHYRINTPHYYSEFAVFLGASYFRAVGKDEVYGLSARGLAIDTALPSGEEFPYFKEYWLVRPGPRATTITLYALLDSQSLTGAYKFVIRPGKATVMHVAATLFLRKQVQKLGMAPLTGMFFYGENTNIRPVDNFQPQVHDCDGLQIVTGTGEWIWRPLINPKRLLVTSFAMTNPKGFGLFQRDTNFNDYQDLHHNYQKRPSTWVIPGKGWGTGRVELVEIPTSSPDNDNIVSYWVPSVEPKPGKPFSFSYELKWGPPDIAAPPGGRVVATWTSPTKNPEVKLYLIDFAGGELRRLPADAKLQADISVSGGEVIEHKIERNPYIDGWRLAFKVRREQGSLEKVKAGAAKPLEMRAFLRQKNSVLTETWSYVDPF
ncbi:MAG: glucan biosynthesis protein G [Deltaproteobacteria bacterium]|nr:glucan biosynthesis protein G [Deltaproteobacteria bacterium]